MTASIRIVDTGLASARWNVAMTAALAERHRAGLTRDTIRFHRYPACVLVGRSQDVTQAADLDYCRTQGIEIARRVTGGGAVYMSPRMLAWDVIVDRGVFGADLKGIMRRIGAGVAAGLARYGVPARFRAPNDIEIGGLKVSGSSGYIDGRSAALQGTVLIEDETSAMAHALRIPESALRERVTNLADTLGRPLAMTDIRDCIVWELSSALQRTPAIGQPSTDEIACAERLLDEEIGTDEFVMGVAPPPLAKGVA
ncbi:MAG: biotin/lipoate A/B protein ligase family protein [Hyphomicrobiaceae bacterium]